ncbi:MAG TPA: hypothetical protein VNV84_00340, partial [Candidatus Acidoferrales bacterium]|nr:hypothetical protein [Candidatus Acidoferrales bacterium]
STASSHFCAKGLPGDQYHCSDCNCHLTEYEADKHTVRAASWVKLLIFFNNSLPLRPEEGNPFPFRQTPVCSYPHEMNQRSTQKQTGYKSSRNNLLENFERMGAHLTRFA